jgi:DNA-nicking Smr family endonuclease
MSGKDEHDSESFANLVGETRDIARGPRLAKMPNKKPRRSPSRENGQSPKNAFRFPDPNEPRLGAANGVSDSQLFALQRGDPEPEERIDLHGLRRNEAGRLIATRLEAAKARGLRCVVVIHGRGRGSETGEAVLRDSISAWLSKTPGAGHVLAFAPAPNRLGGEGATLVLLRRPD